MAHGLKLCAIFCYLIMAETYAYFYIADFECNPNVIIQKLNFKPTETWHKGDAWLPSKAREFSNWEIHSPVSRSEIFVDEHIKAVLEIIEPKREEILEFQKLGYKTGINCVGYYYDEHPGFGLSAELIARLATFSIDVDFDFYCLCKVSDDESD
jgi:hypothetical protein